DLFDATRYPIAVVPGECFACGSERDNWTREQAANFTRICGLIWPRSQLVGYSLRKDRRSLGINSRDIPTRVELCLPCAVEYMKTFNLLLDEAIERRRAT